ncbi:MAG: insulinase family protein [Chloroflexi bacterium]|nr:MAG: insulinase family protein [Chloroflexota bacterium]
MGKQNSQYPNANTIHRHQLPNGITVLIYENFVTESVVIEGLVRTGSLAEIAAQAGLANMTSALLMRGTNQRSFAQIYDALESVGAEVVFGSGYHHTSFSGQGLVEDLDLLLEVVAQSLRGPTFPAVQVEQLRGQIMTGLQMRASDTGQMALLSFREALYQEHPYGRSQRGYDHTIPTITREDIANFHQRHFGPQGMIVTVVGAVKAAAALAKVEALFGDWQVPAQQVVSSVADVARPERVVKTAVSIPDKSQADLVIGLPGPRRSVPDYLDASLMNTILGVFGMMGRIGQTVREEQGLAYYAYSRLQGGLGPTPWMACAGVAPGDIDKATNSILQEIERIQNELISPEELADSQTYRIGSLPVGLETNAGMADVITDMELYELGLDYLLHYPDLIRDITQERIQTAAQKYLSSEQVVVAVAGPPSQRIAPS